MKTITKEAKREVKELIERVGGTENILNLHKNEIEEKLMIKLNIKKGSREWFELLTAIDNKIAYFEYAKGM